MAELEEKNKFLIRLNNSENGLSRLTVHHASYHWTVTTTVTKLGILIVAM
jgi:hypothetical protein